MPPHLELAGKKFLHQLGDLEGGHGAGAADEDVEGTTLFDVNSLHHAFVHRRVGIVLLLLLLLHFVDVIRVVLFK